MDVAYIDGGDLLVVTGSLSGEAQISRIKGGKVPHIQDASTSGLVESLATYQGEEWIFSVEFLHGFEVEPSLECDELEVSFVIGSRDGLIRRFSSYSMEPNIVGGHTAPVSSLSWRKESHRLASGGWDGIVHVWDLSKNEKLYSLPMHDTIACVVWLLDGKLATGCSGINTGDGIRGYNVRVFDEEKILHTFDGHNGSIRNLATVSMTNNLPLILSCANDGNVRIWNANDGSCVACLKTDGQTILLSVCAFKAEIGDEKVF
jgi:WD40 repeat protein